MRGRKIELTEALIDRLASAIGVGATWHLASAYAGISKDTLDRWRKQMVGAAPGTLLAALRERLSQAEGQASVRWLALIGQAAPQDWRAAAWLLSHRYPDQYGSGGVQKVAPTSPDGAQPWQPPVIFLPAQAPSVEQWEQEVAHLRYRVNGSEAP